MPTHSSDRTLIPPLSIQTIQRRLAGLGVIVSDHALIMPRPILTPPTKISLLCALQCQTLALTWPYPTRSPLTQAANIISLIGLMFDMTGAALAFTLSTTPEERIPAREATFRRLANVPWAFALAGTICFAAAIYICTWAMQSPLAFAILVSTTLPLAPATIYVTSQL
jgi:predicted permease